MHRLILVSAVVAVMVALAAGPALAFQCPKLVNQINNETGTRYDPAAAGAKEKATMAAALHGQGKHAEAEKAAKEGLEMIGIKK